ncbi:hypothetical protein JCGZ_26690 [Jatropha curcas]|uniref:Uncharacterized protein n=1 Tax=Jatropha curcas TaxID=180498 RepID=A0A067JJV1_JATCU|nr:hypothetical protein JCGZ_26690 [Jatropha curcas]
MHNWTKSLSKACIRFWDPEAHIFRFGAMMEENVSSQIILQVWLKDHLQAVTAPTFLAYNPSQYRMRRILITHPSTDAWTSWLIELGPNEVGTDDADGTDEEIVMDPRRGEVGEGLAPKDDIEDVAPHRRRDA